MPQGTRSTPSRTALCMALLSISLAGCGLGPGGGGSSFSVEGVPGDWTTDPGGEDQAADAQFNRHGVATGVLLRARDGERLIELFGSFLGTPAEPVFIELQVSYDDGQGAVYEHGPSLLPRDKGKNGILWQRLEIDHDAGVGQARVEVDVPVCFDDYTGPTEFERRCIQLEGSFDTTLHHNRALNLFR